MQRPTSDEQNTEQRLERAAAGLPAGQWTAPKLTVTQIRVATHAAANTVDDGTDGNLLAS